MSFYMLKNIKKNFFVEAKEEAFGLFEEMLSRKEKADSTRNALSVLQRFRFLFNLPANIEKNIRKVRKIH